MRASTYLTLTLAILATGFYVLHPPRYRGECDRLMLRQIDISRKVHGGRCRPSVQAAKWSVRSDLIVLSHYAADADSNRLNLSARIKFCVARSKIESSLLQLSKVTQ